VPFYIRAFLAFREKFTLGNTLFLYFAHSLEGMHRGVQIGAGECILFSGNRIGYLACSQKMDMWAMGFPYWKIQINTENNEKLANSILRVPFDTIYMQDKRL
jgi:hypothetical protein